MSRAEPERPELVAVANCLRIISHPSRLAIALHLLKGPLAVSEIESELGLRQPNLSQHLGVLRDANVLTAKRRAKSVVYELVPGASCDLIDAIRASMQTTGASKTPRAPTASREPARSASLGETRAMSAELDDAAVFAHLLNRTDSD
ncbi:ArsR/SmtB family transcription factor [Pararobbsia silviterrae]|uniref:ArsR family transcriptional regulator n=1 Tax=Pararobbsia silviterrae TaxID=1792498 RepID=A0A494XVM9_9BURK|nr:metalloregulator ArsR/SmtB family transcription factor [Pararobbsia silviterrae]RKP53743.1 ArsR family transcriptional regulator [Pararobbsia silviterrae]